MKKLYYSLTALLFVMAGCSNNDFLDNEGTHAPVAKSRTITSITATMEDDADTRTQLLDGKKVVWTQYDRISVISDEGEMSNYEISDGIGEATATFTGEPVEGSTFWAISPSAWDLDFETKTAGIYWEYSNNVVFGNDGNGVTHSIPMFANEGTDGKFSFKQLGGILHFQITGTGRLVYVWLRSNDGMQFPNHWSINYTADDPLATLTKDDNYSMGSDFIISKPGDEIQLSDTPTDVYFVLPAGMTFAEGFDLSFTIQTEENGIYYQDEIHKRSDNPVTVNRGLVKHFPKYDLTEQKEENIRKVAAPLLALMEANAATWTYPDGLSDDRKWSVSNPIENWYGVILQNGQIMALNLEDHGITTLPAEFFDMPELTYLYLNNNQISSVPEEINNLTKLVELHLGCNSLTTFPEGILALPNLMVLDLGENQIEGTIPEALGNMATLTWVSLCYNNFTGTVPRGFFQNQNLEDLYVQMNKLIDEIPSNEVYGDHVWRYLELDPQQEGYGIVIKQPSTWSFLIEDGVTPLITGNCAALTCEVYEPNVATWQLNFRDYDAVNELEPDTFNVVCFTFKQAFTSDKPFFFPAGEGAEITEYDVEVDLGNWNNRFKRDDSNNVKLIIYHNEDDTYNIRVEKLLLVPENDTQAEALITDFAFDGEFQVILIP